MGRIHNPNFKGLPNLGTIASHSIKLVMGLLSHKKDAFTFGICGFIRKGSVIQTYFNQSYKNQYTGMCLLEDTEL